MESVNVLGVDAGFSTTKDRERFAGSLVATPLCGGNLTEQQVRQWLLEGAPGNE
jgi:hypothetical protein